MSHLVLTFTLQIFGSICLAALALVASLMVRSFLDIPESLWAETSSWLDLNDAIALIQASYQTPFISPNH
jgi:hypothetical protein